MKLRENLHFSCALLSLKTFNKTKLSPLSKKTRPEKMKVGVPARWPVVAPPRRSHKHPLFQNIFMDLLPLLLLNSFPKRIFHKNHTNTLRSNENKTTQTLLPLCYSVQFWSDAPTFFTVPVLFLLAWSSCSKTFCCCGCYGRNQPSDYSVNSVLDLE